MLERELKYQILADNLRQKIIDGTFPAGSKLPSENDLVLSQHMSRQTVRQSMSMLEADGLTKRVRGSGTYVRNIARKSGPLTKNVAVVTTYIGVYIFPDILRGVHEVLESRHYTSIVAATQNRVDNERRVLEELLKKPIDGLLIEGTKTALPNPNLDLYHRFFDAHLPVVFINGYYPDLENTVSVVTDDCEGGRAACTFLLKKGFRRIGGVFKSDDMQGLRRYEGFVEVLHAHELSVVDSRILWYSTDLCDGVLTTSVVQSAKDCDALICYNDEIALRTISLLEKAGRRVPQDIAVISFDDSAFAGLEGIGLTSFANPKEQLGRMAAQKLMNLIDGRSETSAVLQWTLRERQSTSVTPRKIRKL